VLRLDRQILPHQRRGQVVFVDLVFLIGVLQCFRFPIRGNPSNVRDHVTY
jgi:hypothetical protein